MREGVDPAAAVGEVGVKEVAERRQDRAEQDRREPADPGEQITAEADPEHRHDDAEDLRRERHLVLRVLQVIEVERVREARPDVVADRISQDEPDRRQHAPTHPAGELGQRIDERRIEVVHRGAPCPRARVGRGEDFVGLLREIIGERRHDQRHEHRRGDDQHAPGLGEVADRKRLRPRNSGRQHRHRESQQAQDRPQPARAHDRQQGPAHARLERAWLGQRAVQRLALRPHAVGRGQRDRQQPDEHRRHHQVDVRPAHPRGHHQRDRAADDRGGAIAELVDRREQLDRRVFVRLVDPPSVDRDIVGGRRERGDERDQHEAADRDRRVGQPEQCKAHRDDRLAQADPAFAPSEPLEPGQPQPIDHGRPQELERIAEPDPREDANGRKLHPDFAEPRGQRADQQRVRQAGGEAERQHRRRLARAKCDPEQLEPLRARRSGCCFGHRRSSSPAKGSSLACEAGLGRKLSRHPDASQDRSRKGATGGQRSRLSPG